MRMLVCWGLYWVPYLRETTEFVVQLQASPADCIRSACVVALLSFMPLALKYPHPEYSILRSIITQTPDY